MTRVALSFAAEEIVAAMRGGRVEVDAGYRLQSWECELVELQIRKLARNLIIVRREVLVEIRKTVRSGYREPGRVIQAGVVESSLAMHFQYGYEGVPIGGVAA